MALGTHAVVRLDKLLSAYNGNIESVEINQNLDNGSVVNLTGQLVAGSREVMQAALPATATLATAEVLLVASPEITYLAGQTMLDFYNPANTPARAYHLHAGDIFTVSTNALSGGAAIAVGSYVVAQNGSPQLLAQTAVPSGVAFYGIIVESTTLGAYADPAVAIRVIQSNA